MKESEKRNEFHYRQFEYHSKCFWIELPDIIKSEQRYTPLLPVLLKLKHFMRSIPVNLLQPAGIQYSLPDAYGTYVCCSYTAVSG